ncbi:MAG: methyltransferase domain-containing protein [Alphaproteobacteria bacterium]|nr:methyltransferase domain-containing protein [Alphaproteobacteria bacterium]
MAKFADIRLPNDRKAAFEMLWRDELLGNYETLSGASSTLLLSRNVRKSIQYLIDSQTVRSILDVGCGDWNWMSTMNLSGVRYLGIDIVHECIQQNIEKFTEPNVSFMQMDIVLDAPTQKHDLILVRDVFTHLTRKETIAAINNLKRSGGIYFAATSYYVGLANPANRKSFEAQLNANSATAYWRPVNLRHAPYYLPAPLISVIEKKGARVLDIWKLDDIPDLSVDDCDASVSHQTFTADDIRQLAFVKKLSALAFIQRIGLYGSRMQGTSTPDSDIDLMLYCETTPTTAQWMDICDILDHADTPLEIDCKLLCPEVQSILDKPDMYERLIHQMITLYQRPPNAQ